VFQSANDGAPDAQLNVHYGEPWFVVSFAGLTTVDLKE